MKMAIMMDGNKMLDIKVAVKTSLLESRIKRQYKTEMIDMTILHFSSPTIKYIKHPAEKIIVE